jgi:hypothetical protein
MQLEPMAVVAVRVDRLLPEEIRHAQVQEVPRYAALALAVVVLAVVTEKAEWVGLEMAEAEEVVVVVVREAAAAGEAVDRRANVPRRNLLLHKVVALSRTCLRYLRGAGFDTLPVGEQDRAATEVEDQVADEVEEREAGEVDEVDPFVDEPVAVAAVPEGRATRTVREVGRYHVIRRKRDALVLRQCC